ncbi:dual specificity protein phosphatase 8 [Cheilinus undulatus]|uniref:dual specificity protein phosphatase 8 n=1 Tax=Cheilinus undulatus TaxID=241271 RepID=UPI001BD54C27|nr:dual specificity protein phosphatase 8 [Cheilinus undulatus]XP_041634533.1 dual specificity protein phosphatase 8 [Cheilinus undulatus]
MLWTRDRDSEKPPLSTILPRLYLGAESDVTQDCLASLGISYVLSVSRCSPQPSFLPRSRYLRIPIDDSLWDDLLPWIPQALSFIDGAMSSGASVLVHCAAGISRSPALAVAYIMYRLGLDLDQAYRFVKERRPSISPNFNFLGQLQLFQSTLSLSMPAGGVVSHQADCCYADNKERVEHQSDSNPPHSMQRAELPEASEKTASRPEEDVVRRPNETVNLQPDECQDTPPSEPITLQLPASSASKPVTLQLPASSASLQEKRKSLTLSLTPLGVSPDRPSGGAITINNQFKTQDTKDSAHRDHSSTHRDHSSTHRDHSSAQRDHVPAHRKDPGLSPLSLGLSKLLDWGERLLLGGLFVAPVKMGQPALPYRC